MNIQWPLSAIDSLHPPKIPLALLPTPLQPLDRLSAQLPGPRIWIKRDDLTGSTLSGNKVRKLEYVIAEAIAQGCNMLITCGGLQSNHCRATAFAGAQLGLPVHLLLRGAAPSSSDGNLLLDRLAGAEISYYPGEDYGAIINGLFEQWVYHYQQQGLTPYCIPMGASDGVGTWGYLSACAELRQDFDRLGIKPSYIICATGSAGTQAGLTLGSYQYGLNAQVIGMAVCDNEAYFQEKVAADIRDWQARYLPDEKQPLTDALSIQTNDRYIGPGYAKADTEVFDTIAWLAREEGVLLDPVYTAKAFHGLITELRQGHYSDADDIVFVHTGGQFGLFPHGMSAQMAARSQFGTT